MEREYWLNRWQRSEIGFHQGEVSRLLARHWPGLAVPNGGRVLVPLCGKSLDIRWLRDRGHRVLGIEISPRAVRDFYAENRLAPVREDDGTFERWRSGEIEILCGDLFDLDAARAVDVAAVYDRASLIALPPETRARYAAHLMEVLAGKAPMLLITLEYEQAEMTGPPFSVTAAEVQSLYGGRYRVERLESRDALAENPKFRERGLTRLVETAYALR